MKQRRLDRGSMALAKRSTRDHMSDDPDACAQRTARVAHPAAAGRRLIVTLHRALLTMSVSCSSHLGPVRHIFQSFLSDAEAALLMRVGHTAMSLLSGYSFCQHVFRPGSPSGLSSMKALYERWDMRITRMCFLRGWYGPLTDAVSGKSLLPSSLLALALGWVPEKEEATSMFAHLATLTATGDLWEEETNAGTSNNGSTLLQRVQPHSSWRIKPYSHAYGCHSLPIPLGAIPHGVRFLQLSYHFDHPLLPGSIPSTVRFLQCGHSFSQPLDGLLPEGLTHLILGDKFTAQLLPGSLPSSLQRLRLGAFDQPLHISSLPPHIQRLDMGLCFNQPLPPFVLPASLTHLKLSDRFSQQLVRDSIPSGVVHLSLGSAFDWPLQPGVLPSSLHELVLGDSFKQPLEPGSLPCHLRLLRLPGGYSQPLRSSLLPSSLHLVDLNGYAGEVAKGVLPAALPWLAMHELQMSRIEVPSNTCCIMGWDMFG